MKRAECIFFIFLFFLFLTEGCAERETDFVSDTPESYPHVELKGTTTGLLLKTSLPYYAADNVIIPEGGSLAIDPGVEIYFPENKGLIVYGRLTINGTANAPVIFTALDKNWGGVKFINSTGSSISFCNIRNTFTNTDPSYYYSAVTFINSAASFSNCIFSGNSAIYGGAMYIDSSSVDVYNCIFTNNYASSYGGAVFANSSYCTFTNNTFYKNITDNFGGAVTLFNARSSEFQNNLFYFNSGRSGDNSIASSVYDSQFILQSYNFSSLNLDPLFVSDKDLHLQENSPCINAGNPDSDFNDYNGTRNDIGAYGGKSGNW